MPNGVTKEDIGLFQFGTQYTAFPINCSKINVKCIVKTNMDEEEQEYIREFVDENPSRHCYKNSFLLDDLDETLVFDVKMTIMKVFDFGSNIVWEDKWIDHNIVPTDS